MLLQAGHAVSRAEKQFIFLKNHVFLSHDVSQGGIHFALNKKYN